jgi:WD40 repeat protein
LGLEDSTVDVWNVATHTRVYTYTGHASTATILTVGWSPDGKRIASGDDLGIVEVWDALTGQHAYAYRGHADIYTGHWSSSNPVNSLAWSPDSSHIASASNDNTVQVWVDQR